MAEGRDCTFYASLTKAFSKCWVGNMTLLVLAYASPEIVDFSKEIFVLQQPHSKLLDMKFKSWKGEISVLEPQLLTKSEAFYQ